MVTKCFFDYLEQFKNEAKDKTFLFDEQKGYSAEEAFDQAVVLGNRLYEYGVRMGDQVALRCTRSLETYVLYLTLQMMGAVALLTDPHQTVADFLDNTMVKMDAKFSITNEVANGGVTACGDWEVLGHGALAFNYPPQKEQRKFPVGRDILGPSTVIFTSGSTGKSKAVVLCQQGLLQHLEDSLVYDGWNDKNDVGIFTLTVNHGFGLDFLNAAISCGYPLFFPKAVNVEYVLECVEKYKITRLNAIPSYLYNIALKNETEKRDVSSLRIAFIGGAPIVKEQVLYIEDKLGMTVHSQYGMSECSTVTRTIPSDPIDVRTGSVGRCDHGGACVVDKDGNVLPPRQEGEICMIGIGVMLGYYGDEELTKKSIDEQGRLHSGDLGYMDEEGNFYICGRIKDIIIRNGYNLIPNRIEQNIRKVNGVKEVVVVGTRDDRLGEVPCAFVVFNEGQEVEEQAFKASLYDLMPKNEVPEHYIFAKEMPLNNVGKPDKVYIKKLFEQA